MTGVSTWIEYNPNPEGRRVGDCSVRAVAAALGVNWETAFALTAAAGYALGDIQNADSVWGKVLRDHGFSRYAVPNTCPDCYTAEDFALDHPRGVYVLGFGGHVATIRDGRLMDSWDSSHEIPQFYWHKEE